MNLTHRLTTIPALAALATLLLSACGGGELETDTTRQGLGNAKVQSLKAQIVALASANTTRDDNIAQVRAQLQPLVDQLAAHFAQNRPADEVALTQRTWRSIWYDDADIDNNGPAFIKLDRANIYQVVEADYYYNVSNSKLRWFGKTVGTVQTYLKGEYTLSERPDASNAGQQRLNVINLKFVDNRLRLGSLPKNKPLADIVDRVDRRVRLTLPIPGPIGITGQLWNLYVDDELRISAGNQDDDPGVTDLYILRAVERAGE
jgi:hypothetical protein